MDRNASTKNQNSADVQTSIQMHEGCSTDQTTYVVTRSLVGKHLRASLLSLKKWSRWFNHRLNDWNKKFKEIGRWFSGKSLEDVDENDIISGIGYFMSKNYSENSKIEDALEHLDGVIHKVQSIIMQEIHNDFIPRNMASLFMESSISHKALQCLKQIDSHGVLQGVSPTYVSKEMKKWRKEVGDIDMGWERTVGLTYGVRVKHVKSYASFMVESYEKRTGSRVIEVSFKLGIDFRVHYDRGGQVCEILFELLEDSGLVSCVILGKWYGK